MLNPAFRDILSEFNAARVDYVVVGAFAVAAHGLPRSTGDIDLLVRADAENADRAWRALSRFGAPMDSISRTDLTTPDTVIQIGVAPSRIDVLTSIDGVEFDEAWRARMVVEIDGLSVPVIGKAQLIANKRATGRPQDLADASRLESGGNA